MFSTGKNRDIFALIVVFAFVRVRKDADAPEVLATHLKGTALRGNASEANNVTQVDRD